MVFEFYRVLYGFCRDLRGFVGFKHVFEVFYRVWRGCFWGVKFEDFVCWCGGVFGRSVFFCFSH